MRSTCLRLVGHTSATGLAERNQTLSLARAGRVRNELIYRRPPLARQTNAVGRGSTQLLVGSGSDDATDVLDRRVEFEIRPCLVASTDFPGRGYSADIASVERRHVVETLHGDALLTQLAAAESR